MSSVRKSAFRSIPLPTPWAPITHDENLLLTMGVLKSIAGVENAEVVDILDIALTEIKTRMESLCKEVKSIECFGLGFGNGRDFRRSREGLIPCKCPSSILNYDSLFVLVGRGQIMKQGAFVVGVLGVTETVLGVSNAMRGPGLAAGKPILTYQ